MTGQNRITRIAVLVVIVAMAMPVLPQEKTGAENTDIPESEKQEEKSDGTEKKALPPHVMNLVPGRVQRESMVKTLCLDLAVPGGGFFYRQEWLLGAGFAAARVAAGLTAWYFFHECDYYRSLYRSSSRANSIIDPGNELLFRMPDGTYRTVRRMKRDYDSSVQRVTITMAVNVVILAASLLLNYQAVSETNADNSPSFNAWYATGPCGQGGTVRMEIAFRF